MRGSRKQPTTRGDNGPQGRARPIFKATAPDPSCLLCVAGKPGVGTTRLDGSNGCKSAHVARQETANW
eukprot:6533907-Alexandrium_andersonii.AAC.1